MEHLFSRHDIDNEDYILENCRTDELHLTSYFDPESLLAEPLVGSSSEFAFVEDFEPTPIRTDVAHTPLSSSSSISNFGIDLSMFEPTPMRPRAPPPTQNRHPDNSDRYVIDRPGFPVMRPQATIPSTSELLTQQQPQQASFGMNQDVGFQMTLLQMRQLLQMQAGPQQQQPMSGAPSGQVNQSVGQPNAQPPIMPIQQQSTFVNAVHNHPSGPLLGAQSTHAQLANDSQEEGIPPQHRQTPSNTTAASANLHEYGHAMEKLCETMNCSAMSRTLVKHLSSRSPTRKGSSRALTKQNSGRDLSVLALQASGRGDAAILQKQNSGRNIMMQKQLSARKVTQTGTNGLDSTKGSSTSAVQSSAHDRLTPTHVPSRRSTASSKHRIVREGQE